MQPRLNPYRAAPDATKTLAAIQDYLVTSGLEHSLIEFVKIRTSQINFCAYCINLHTHQTRERDEARSAWTEAVTRIIETHAPDTDFEALKEHFKRDRDRSAHARHRSHECLEPHGDQLPLGVSGQAAANCDLDESDSPQSIRMTRG